MKNIDAVEIIIRNQSGAINTCTLGELKLINGAKNPVVAGISASLMFEIPAAFSDSLGNIIIEAKEKDNTFILGHEQGHIALGHLNGAVGIMDNPEFEHAADLYAIEQGYCTKEDALKQLYRLKDALLGKGFLRKIVGLTLFRKGIRDLKIRISRLKTI